MIEDSKLKYCRFQQYLYRTPISSLRCCHIKTGKSGPVVTLPNSQGDNSNTHYAKYDQLLNDKRPLDIKSNRRNVA